MIKLVRAEVRYHLPTLYLKLDVPMTRITCNIYTLLCSIPSAHVERRYIQISIESSRRCMKIREGILRLYISVSTCRDALSKFPSP